MSPQLFYMKYSTSQHPRWNHSDFLHCEKLLSICALLIWRWQNSQSFFHLLSQKKRISVFFQPALAMRPFPASAEHHPRTAALCSVADGRSPPLFHVVTGPVTGSTGSGLTSHELPGWCSPFAMVHQSNSVAGTWVRPVWVAGMARLLSSLEGKEGGAGGRVSGWRGMTIIPLGINPGWQLISYRLVPITRSIWGAVGAPLLWACLGLRQLTLRWKSLYPIIHPLRHPGPLYFVFSAPCHLFSSLILIFLGCHVCPSKRCFLHNLASTLMWFVRLHIWVSLVVFGYLSSITALVKFSCQSFI